MRDKYNLGFNKKDQGIYYIAYVLENLNRRFNIEIKEIIEIITVPTLKNLYDNNDIYHSQTIDWLIEDLNLDHIDMIKDCDIKNKELPRATGIARTMAHIIALLEFNKRIASFYFLLNLYSTEWHIMFKDYSTAYFYSSLYEHLEDLEAEGFLDEEFYLTQKSLDCIQKLMV